MKKGKNAVKSLAKPGELQGNNFHTLAVVAIPKQLDCFIKWKLDYISLSLENT